MRAVVISTGDELTTGRTLDTNANYLADQLVGVGVDVVSMLVVGDYPERIAWAWRTALEQAELIVCTGGLGPTADDLTTETVARVADRRLVMDQAVADRIRQMFAAMGRAMPENNLKQALFPDGATIVPNALGTAPGFRLEIATSHGSCHCVVLPGVPREMKAMLADQVLPWLRDLRSGSDEYRSHSFQTFGISESALDELVAGAVDPAEGRIAFRAAFPQISVRVTVHAPPGEVERRLAAAATKLRERLGAYCYGEGNTTMEAVVGELLTRAGATLAVAESCSGGLIGHRLTDVPGSSAYVARRRGRIQQRGEAVAARGVAGDPRAARCRELRGRRGDGARGAPPGRCDDGARRPPASPAPTAARRRSRSVRSALPSTAPPAPAATATSSGARATGSSC